MIADYGSIFTLQRAAYLDEARLYRTVDTPALNETFVQFSARLDGSDSWVATDQDRIIGAVSLRADGDIHEVERLMVAPDRRSEGVSTRLMDAVEHSAIDAGLGSLQLTFGDLALNNQSIYEHLGWRRIDSFHPAEFEHVLLHVMTKNLT